MMSTLAPILAINMLTKIAGIVLVIVVISIIVLKIKQK